MYEWRGTQVPFVTVALVITIRRPIAALLALVAVLALAGGLAACGGSSSSNAGAQELLAQTFGPDKPVRSGKLDLGLNLDLKGVKNLGGPVVITLKGPFQSAGKGKLPSFDFSATLAAAGQNLSAGAVSTGDKGFVRFQGKSYVLSDPIFASFKQGYEKAQNQTTKKSSGTSLRALGIDPRRWLKDATKAGEEKVGGADTVHIKAAIDVPKFLDDVNTLLARADRIGVAGSTGSKVPSKLTDQQRQQIERAVKSARIDVWTGKDDTTLRKLAIVVDLDVPADARNKAGGLTTGRVSFNLAIAELNKDQTISAPAGARPLTELTAQFSSLLGAATGSGGTSSGSSGSGASTPTTSTPAAPGATSGSAPKAYLDCLQKAGSDVAAVQKCAALLNGG